VRHPYFQGRAGTCRVGKGRVGSGS
jgi:hypothetical protein